jgi:hypothetical protein
MISQVIHLLVVIYNGMNLKLGSKKEIARSSVSIVHSDPSNLADAIKIRKQLENDVQQL